MFLLGCLILDTSLPGVCVFALDGLQESRSVRGIVLPKTSLTPYKLAISSSYKKRRFDIRCCYLGSMSLVSCLTKAKAHSYSLFILHSLASHSPYLVRSTEKERTHVCKKNTGNCKIARKFRHEEEKRKVRSCCNHTFSETSRSNTSSPYFLTLHTFYFEREREREREHQLIQRYG